MKDGWQTNKLGEICSFLNRGISPRYLESGGICVLNQRCIRDHRVRYELSRRHDALAKNVGSERLVRAGDVLVNSTSTGTLGRVAQLRENPLEATTVDSHVTIVRPKPKKFFAEFFGYMLLTIEEDIQDAGEGCGGQTELARSALAEKFSVHYPESLREQERIVGILDEVFESIATSKANAEKNLLSARALFDSLLQSIFARRGEGWVEKTLEEVANANCTLSYGIVQPGDEYPNGLPVVRPTDLTTKVIRLSGLKRIDSKLAAAYRRTTLCGGELLLCVRGSTGVVSIASTELVGANVTRGIVPIRFDGALLTQDFGFHLMSSGEIQSQIREKTYGAALMQINIRDLRNVMLSFPPLEEQERIAAKLDTLDAETQRLESVYRRKLAALDALKKTVLHQAFIGGL